MSCISFLNTCPEPRESEQRLLSKILQVLNDGGGGGGGGGGVTSINFNGGGAQAGAVSINAVTSVNGDTGPAVTFGYVSSVNGDTGPAVLLDTDDIPEGAANFYFTNARFDARLATKTTTDLAEGANLYFTEARVRATVLTGLVSALGTITAADSVLSAFGKTEGRLAALEAGTAGPFVLKAGDTMTGQLVITPSVANTTGLTINAGTLTAVSAEVLKVNATFNNGGGAFKGVYVAVTNTASNPTNSHLFRADVDGSFRFGVSSSGSTLCANTNASSLGVSQTLTGTSAIACLPITATLSTTGTPVIMDFSVADSGPTGANTKFIRCQHGPTFLGLTEKFYVLKTGAGFFASTLTLGAALYTAVATLADGANIATDASLANHFRVTLGGNRTLSNPTNPVDGQRIVYEVIQDGTGSRTLAFDTKFAFGSDISSVTLSTGINLRDFITVVYNLAADKWYVVAFVKGY